MPDYEPNLVISTEDFNVVGTRPVRHDGPDKVIGRARYAADIHLPEAVLWRIDMSQPNRNCQAGADRYNRLFPAWMGAFHIGPMELEVGCRRRKHARIR